MIKNKDSNSIIKKTTLFDFFNSVGKWTCKFDEN